LIRFVHIRNTRNTGDRASCPDVWFDFGLDVEVLNYSDPVPDGGTVVYGGGTLINWLATRRGPLPRARHVIWGAGSSRSGMTAPWPDPEGFDLVGIRDWSVEREAMGRYAPCVSCMSPLFDRDRPVTREAVAFVNADPSKRRPVVNLPTMDNTAPMERIVEFLASAEVVVTNSYHGVYWATLLGRHVVCVPYSSKFHGFRHPPTMSRDGADWRGKARTAPAYPEALESSRAATRAFHARVMEVIGG
jgi:hypothetical protein